MLLQIRPLILSIVLVAGSAGPLVAGDRGRDRPGDGGWRDRPQIYIEPNIDLSRPERPNIDTPDAVMAALTDCARAGMRSFVDCLRPNYGSVMIRRLEACVQSETIPDDPSRVRACLPPASLR